MYAYFIGLLDFICAQKYSSMFCVCVRVIVCPGASISLGIWVYTVHGYHIFDQSYFRHY